MANDAEHVFMCLLAMCVSSLMKCLFKFFAHFKLSFVFLMFRSKNSVYIPHRRPLSDIWFTNTFSCELPFHFVESVRDAREFLEF